MKAHAEVVSRGQAGDNSVSVAADTQLPYPLQCQNETCMMGDTCSSPTHADNSRFTYIWAKFHTRTTSKS